MRSKLPNTGTNIFTVMSALATRHNAINLSQGFPNFNPPDELQSLVSEYMQRGFNQYAPMAGAQPLRERLSEKMLDLYGRNLNPDTEITITAGGTQALFTAIMAFVHPGDEVIIFEPSYDSYIPVIELSGGHVRPYRLQYPDYNIDWQEVSTMITPRTRLIILNTPNNPTGRIWHTEDMLALQRITEGTDIVIVSDEVYEHLLFDGARHESILRYPEMQSRALAIYSFGKTYHATGWKSGYCMGDATLMAEFRKVHQFNVFSVNTPLQMALADYLTRREAYLGLPDFYAQKRDFFREAMTESRFRLLPCEGTYFQLADYSDISDEADLDFAKRVTAEFGVASVPVSAFYHDRHDDRVIRFCFAKTEDFLAEAARRLCTI